MLGEKIRSFRKQKHMTIQEMAKSTELSGIFLIPTRQSSL